MLFDLFTRGYTVAVIGLDSRKYNRVFTTREAANEYMYKVCYKLGLTINKI